ncbi:MAG: ornithine carbamoyltransferase [Porticoccus sp.]|jgi:ornithine carbamoyltransferase|nr:ornithine carbamoyltransferase [Porticoccus sp.]
MGSRHFLTLKDLSRKELKKILLRAAQLKEEHKKGVIYQPFIGKVMAMIFEKSSTRTRVSFETGMAQLGGSALFLSPNDTQLGRGECTEDSARVISSMVDIIMMRTFSQRYIENFALHSSVPVINALTDDHHPCQLLADMQAFIELRGDIEGKKVTWIGDGNNMCQTYMHAAGMLDFQLKIGCPRGFEPQETISDELKENVTLVHDPVEAVAGADLVITDTWTSMGQESEKILRKKSFKDFQVNESLMEKSNERSLFMHCLPAYRGEEINDTIMDSGYSAVWLAAENRLHSQKALIEFLLSEKKLK